MRRFNVAHPAIRALDRTADRAIYNLPPCCAFPGFTYAVVDASRLTKIGSTMNLQQRMRDLQACNGSQIVLVGICRDPRVESLLHGRYDAQRRHGEWFDLEHQPLPIRTEEGGRRRCFGCSEDGLTAGERHALDGLRNSKGVTDGVTEWVSDVTTPDHTGDKPDGSDNE